MEITLNPTDASPRATSWRVRARLLRDMSREMNISHVIAAVGGAVTFLGMIHGQK